MKAAVAIPAVLLLLMETIALVATAVTGENPRAPVVTLNLSEAVAVRDGAEMVRLIESGEDPNARRPVRAGLLGDDAVNATPLEAAVSIRRSELMVWLYDSGARTDAATWTRLWCAAHDELFAEVQAELNARKPPDAATECTGSETILGQ